MVRDTRQRLAEAASSLFAERGYLGASVRDICNRAGTNPGAVSYHFGGKRQLYRLVLRQAAERLVPPRGRRGAGEVEAVLGEVFRQIRSNPREARLLLRDLADGGDAAVGALEPVLRSAHDALATDIGDADSPRGSPRSRAAFLALASPVVVMTVAWPVVSRALHLDPDDQDRLFEDLVRGITDSRGL